jgi:hypothetical protein
VFVGWTGGHGGGIGLGRCLSFRSWLAAAVSRYYRSKVGKRYFNARSSFSTPYAESTMWSILLGVPCSRTAKLHLARQRRQTASTFKRICLGLSALIELMVWLTRGSLCMKRCTRICGENGPADPVPKYCLGNGVVASIWWWSGSSRRWASVAADNLRSYVRDSDPKQCGRRLSSSEFYYGCYSRDWERKAQSSFVPRSGGLLNDNISRRGALELTAMRWDMLLRVFWIYRAYCPAEPTSSMDIALRAAGIPPHGL